MFLKKAMVLELNSNATRFGIQRIYPSHFAVCGHSGHRHVLQRHGRKGKHNEQSGAQPDIALQVDIQPAGANVLEDGRLGEHFAFGIHSAHQSNTGAVKPLASPPHRNIRALSTAPILLET
jgi:hypothetical protein